MSEVIDISDKYKDRCDFSKVIATSLWKEGMEVDRKGSKKPIK